LYGPKIFVNPFRTDVSTDSCNNAYRQTFLDVNCTTLLATTLLEAQSSGCINWQVESAQYSTITACTTSTTAPVPFQAAIVTYVTAFSCLLHYKLPRNVFIFIIVVLVFWQVLS
jgi:hypothetical protein